MELTQEKENKEITGSEQDQSFLLGNELFSQIELHLPLEGSTLLRVPCATLGLTSQPSLPASMMP